MNGGSTVEVFSTEVLAVREVADVIEVLLVRSPVPYRLDKHRHQLRAHLEQAWRRGDKVQVCVDWECQELLEVL